MIVVLAPLKSAKSTIKLLHPGLGYANPIALKSAVTGRGPGGQSDPFVPTSAPVLACAGDGAVGP